MSLPPLKGPALSLPPATDPLVASREVADRANRLLRLSAGLNAAVTQEEVAEVVFREAISAVGADAGVLALLRKDASVGGSQFYVLHTEGFDASQAARYKTFPLSAGRPMSDAIFTRAPVVLQSFPEAPRDDGSGDPYATFIAVPVVHADTPIAALGFSFIETQYLNDSSRTFLSTVAELCAQALERSRLTTAMSRQFSHAALLAKASDMLSSSLDYQATLRHVATSAVPDLADWCAVDVVKDPESGIWPPRTDRVAVIHDDPARLELSRSMETRFPTDWSATTGMAQVLRDGTPQFYPEITDEMLRLGARSPEHLVAVRSLDLSSIIMVPLKARGLILGALTLAMSKGSGRLFDTDDLGLAQDLARRAGIAVDNARLFAAAERSRAAAETARRAAMEASRAKSAFLATMSHEIRTPINAIIGYSELLTMGLSGPLTPDQDKHLSRIQSSTQHLLTLVEEILDLSKVEAGTLRVQIDRASSMDVAQSAVSLVRSQAAAKSIRLSLLPWSGGDAIYLGDEGRVRQILGNLLTNSIKFTSPDGTVDLSWDLAVAGTVPLPSARLDHGTSYVCFCVADTGSGIEADQLERIFEPFVQADEGEKSHYSRTQGGAGLGLAISRNLARIMKGDVTASSVRGEGSTFTLWLPQAT